jgi:hypothetical protein
MKPSFSFTTRRPGVRIPSRVWQKGIPIYATYGVTKAALRSFVRTWTAELAGKRIRANMISPGPTETPILKGQFGENTDAMKERFTRNSCGWLSSQTLNDRSNVCSKYSGPAIRRRPAAHRRTASLAARSLGLDCGPMSGFNNAKVDEEVFPVGEKTVEREEDVFPTSRLKSNFLCNLGYGDVPWA